MTLSLIGDLDLRHPKFNALRFLYLWLVLATYNVNDCDFFMKADMDAYVNVPAVLKALRRFNASEPVYVGQLTQSHGPSYVGWENFAHGSNDLPTLLACCLVMLTVVKCPVYS